jgi:ankyrin repeat protein
VNSDGDTALHWAAFRGNRRILRKLIAAKADVDARDNFFG